MVGFEYLFHSFAYAHCAFCAHEKWESMELMGLYGKGLKTVKKGKPDTFQGLTEFLCFALSRR